MLPRPVVEDKGLRNSGCRGHDTCGPVPIRLIYANMLKIPSKENYHQFPGNLGALLDYSKELHPDRNGIGTPDQMFTFAEYHDRVCRLVHGLRKIGIERNDRVIVSSFDPLGYASISLAIFRIGAVVVPLNPRMGRYEFAHIISETRPKCVICNRDNISTALKAYTLSQCPISPHLITIDEKAPSIPFIEDLDLSNASSHWEKMTPDETAMIVYTAAMDGYPLGAKLTHGSLFYDTVAFAGKSFGRNDTHPEILFSLLPLFHTYGFTNGFLVPLAGSVTCLLLGTSIRGRTVVGLMENYRPTQIISVPAIFHTLIKPLSERPEFCSRVRNLTSGGIKISKRLLDIYKRKLGLVISEGYGLTEASPVVTWNGLDRPPKFGTVGPPLSCCQVKIVDDSGKELPPGQEGEVLVRGLNIFSGYLDKPEHTQDAFTDGWLKTGDLGSLDEENYLTLTGLKKDMINVFGLKVYPKEVERLLMYHPNIESAHIWEEWHRKYGEIVVGEIFLRQGSVMNERGFFNWCRQNISPYKIPRKIRMIQAPQY
ncbi:MAG: AMP-binding protein [Pseudomonadota bacterium]